MPSTTVLTCVFEIDLTPLVGLIGVVIVRFEAFDRVFAADHIQPGMTRNEMLGKNYQTVEIMVDGHDDQVITVLHLNSIEIVELLCFFWKHLKVPC